MTKKIIKMSTNPYKIIISLRDISLTLLTQEASKLFTAKHWIPPPPPKKEIHTSTLCTSWAETNVWDRLRYHAGALSWRKDWMHSQHASSEVTQFQQWNTSLLPLTHALFTQEMTSCWVSLGFWCSACYLPFRERHVSLHLLLTLNILPSAVLRSGDELDCRAYARTKKKTTYEDEYRAVTALWIKYMHASITI